MYKTVLSIAILLISLSALSKDRVQDVFILDTLLSFSKGSPYDDDLSLAFDNNQLWVYTPGVRKDTLDFKIIDLETRELRKATCLFPSMYFKINNPESTDMAISKDYICLFFSGKDILAIIKRKKDKLFLSKLVPVKEEFEFFELKNNCIFFAKHYNYHPKSSPRKTVMGRFNIKTGALEKLIIPPFKNIQFSHFNPNKWVSFGEKFNCFSQTTDYNIKIYDNELNLHDSISLKKKESWKSVAQSDIDVLLNAKVGAKDIIALLEPIEYEYSRIERIYQVRDDLLYVVWIPEFYKKNNYYRKIDIWKGDQKGHFTLMHENLLDAQLQLDKTISNEYFPVRMNFHSNYFYQDKMVQWKFGTGIDPIGKTLNELYQQEDDYYIENDSKYVVKIFSVSEL